MLIGIDATGLHGPRTGIENYILNIINNIIKLDVSNKYIIYCRNEIPQEFIETGNKVCFKSLSIPNRKIFQQLILPIIAAKDRIQCMFYPGGTMPVFNSCTTVLTVHDIFPFVIPNHMPKYHKNLNMAKLNNIYWKYINKIGAKKASVIISVSKSTKSDLIKTFNIDETKIHVIYEAMSSGLDLQKSKDKNKEFIDRFEINKPYLLCVGTGAYKNLEGSINAFIKLKEEHWFFDTELIITGPKERLTEDTKRLIYNSKHSKYIRFLGFFPQEYLGELYSNAELFLFPSFYEGFGIPILEAYTCGVPVVTSNVSSMPELAGNAALLVNPSNLDDIVNCIRSVLTNRETRDMMVRNGYEQVKSFSWSKAAKETIEVFNKI